MGAGRKRSDRILVEALHRVVCFEGEGLLIKSAIREKSGAVSRRLLGPAHGAGWTAGKEPLLGTDVGPARLRG